VTYQEKERYLLTLVEIAEQSQQCIGILLDVFFKILRKNCDFFGTFFRLSREIIRGFFVGIIVSNITALKALFQPESTPFSINADNELFAD